MALNVTRVDVWAASIEDQPGGLRRSWRRWRRPACSWNSSSPGGRRTSPVRESYSDAAGGPGPAASGQEGRFREDQEHALGAR